MTTAVTVDAHAGWPVRVMLINKNGSIASDTKMQPGTKEIFHVHSGAWLKVVEMDHKPHNEEATNG